MKDILKSDTTKELLKKDRRTPVQANMVNVHSCRESDVWLYLVLREWSNNRPSLYFDFEHKTNNRVNNIIKIGKNQYKLVYESLFNCKIQSFGMTLRSKSTSKESMLKKYLQLKVTMMDKNTRELKQMMMLVNKERYPKLSELSKDGRKITQQDLDGTEVGPSYFYAFMLSKDALKGGLA